MSRRAVQPAVYIMASGRNGTLYVGVTSDLGKRAWQHRTGVGGFTGQYGCRLLVYYEQCGDMLTAIGREKQLKAGRRATKLALIEAVNPQWRDLYADVLGLWDSSASDLA